MRGRLFLLLGILSLLAGAAWSATGSIPVSDAQPQLQVIDKGPDAVTYHVRVGELRTLDVHTKAGDFTRLLIPGFHVSHREGAPELPMMNDLLAIPVGADARVEIVSDNPREIKLSDFGITNPIMPAQPPLSKSADPAQVPFVYDRAAYAADKVAQPLARVVALGNLRSLPVGRLEISPVEYLPREGRLIVHDDLEIRVVFEGGDKALQRDLLASTYSPFFEPVYARITGAKDAAHDAHPDLVRSPVTMVVVTPPEFQYQLNDFVAWKTERGFNMVVGVIGSPEVGSTTSTIQAWLHGLYNNATPEQPAPSFVLFVGDVAQCPTFFENGDATDRPYCDVDGDMFPDMYYGRFSATNSSQLQAMLDKTMMYDQFTMPDPSYLGEVVMIAGADATYGPTHGNGQINYGTEHYFNAAHGITSHTYLYPASASSDAQVIADVSNGVGFVNYTAHGSETGWYDPSFGQADVNGLSNAGKYCLAIGNCCLTSTYDYDECFAETWLRAPNKGAIGYIGGSNSTYWDEDYWWGVGYHPSSEIDGSAYPYEQTGMGTYDGLFHDHGENPAQWYVTNDAIIFCGNLAVTESGSSRELYYWNIYNLMGDPSLSTYLGVPAANPVVHAPTLFANATTFEIDAAPGSYFGLTQNGQIMASGLVPAGGKAVFPLSGMLTPGVPAHLVVMAQNFEPYVTDINVIVPATVVIDPSAIDANVPTDVTVTVYGEDGVTPLAGIEVWAQGMQYATPHVTTDASGVAVLNIDYPYGPSIEIVGKDPAESYDLFHELLTVNAAALTSPDLAVTTDIGLSDAFPLNLPATLTASVGEAGATLGAYLPDGSLVTTADASMVLTVDQPGQVTGVIALSGYDIYSETFDVVEAYGTLAGHVDAGGTGAAGAEVVGLDGDGQVAFTAVCDANGDYAVADEVLVAAYTVVVDYFGFEHFEQSYFVNYGANTFDITLTPAPSGVLTGTVYDAVDGTALAATISVYRTDTGDLYAETTSDATTGEFTTPSLPYFTYHVVVRASHHVPVQLDIEIGAPVVTKSFAMEPTNGEILVINDNGAVKSHPAKVDEKGNVLAPAYEDTRAKSAVDDIVADLEFLGYGVTVEGIGETDPATWQLYDLLLVTCGDNTTTLDDAGFRAALEDFVQAGGHLLVEGGEIGYDWQYNDAAFAANVLHIADWTHDSSGDVTVAEPGHTLMTTPNTITGPIAVTYAGYGDSDALIPTADAVMVGNWSEYPTDASIIAYDANPDPSGGQFVLFAFNYAAAYCSELTDLLQNAVNWLLTEEHGCASIEGTVTLAGETDHSGITVEAIPGGGATVTDAGGHYTFTGLYQGTYTIRASKDGWGVAQVTVVVDDCGTFTAEPMELAPIATEQFCSQPGVAIPDDDPAGISDVMTVDMDPATLLSGVEVYVDITHTWQGDLIVNLTSPGGTTVTLHNRSGSSADDILGWYPTELEPAGDLSAFVGEPAAGDWTLWVSDNAGADVGTLNEWCLKLTYSMPVPNDAAAMSASSGSGGVVLTWSYDQQAVDGFHVYRRVEGGSLERLTDDPVASRDGHIEFVDPGYGIAPGTVLYYSYSEVIGGVEMARSAEVSVTFTGNVPATFALHPCYPNPFNPATNIMFDLPRPGHVVARIYDVTGRVVRTLVDEDLPASVHVRRWDGTDDSGRRMASGTYYLRLTTPDHVAVQKMLLVK